MAEQFMCAVGHDAVPMVPTASSVPAAQHYTCPTCGREVLVRWRAPGLGEITTLRGSSVLADQRRWELYTLQCKAKIAHDVLNQYEQFVERQARERERHHADQLDRFTGAQADLLERAAAHAARFQQAQFSHDHAMEALRFKHKIDVEALRHQHQVALEAFRSLRRGDRERLLKIAFLEDQRRTQMDAIMRLASDAVPRNQSLIELETHLSQLQAQVGQLAQEFRQWDADAAAYTTRWSQMLIERRTSYEALACELPTDASASPWTWELTNALGDTLLQLLLLGLAIVGVQVCTYGPR